MCPIVTAIDKMIQVYSYKYILYIVYMLNLTDYVHHCVCTNELSNLCLVREQLNSYKVNHSFFVCCFRFNQTFNASTYFMQTVLFTRLNFSMHVNWFYHKMELDWKINSNKKFRTVICSPTRVYTRQPFLESNSDTLPPYRDFLTPINHPPAWYLLIIDWLLYLGFMMHSPVSVFCVLYNSGHLITRC